MALDLFRIALGLGIDLSDGSEGANVLVGTGAPGGDAAQQDAAPIGSIYLRKDANSSVSAVWQKIADTDSASDWVQSASKDYVDAAINGLSWREPVLVRDNTLYADITAAETAANVGDTVDGVTITAGDRLLFTNLTTGNENVYVVSGSSGAWTFTEDTNLATDGDALLVQDGTNADSQWVYDGTTWVQFSNSTSLAELGFIRSFIGKDASGSETPTYSSTDVVTQNGNLETAIGELDAAIGDRTYTEDNYVTDGETITQSIDSLDQAVAANSLVRVVTTGITTPVSVDSVLVDEYQTVKWLVSVFQESAPATKEAFEIYALHNGHAAADATEADFSQAFKLRLGNIPGLNVNVVLAGSGVSQTMELQVEAGSAVTVNVTRIAVEI